MTDKDLLILKTDLVECNGIYVSDSDTAATVWDTLAIENPTEAVVSAPNEEAARLKSLAQIKELKKMSPEGVFLDLGCGYGRIAQYLLPQRTYTRYVGLDSSLEMLKLFQARYRKEAAEQTTSLTLVHSDIHTLPLVDSSVDTVVVAAVFLHNHKSVTKKSIAEITRVLKPGGKLFVYSSFPNKFSLMGLQGVIYQFGLDFFGHSHKNGPVRYYGKKEVCNMLHLFEDIQITPYGFAIFPKRIVVLPSIINKYYGRFIARPINRILEFILPTFITQFFPSHHDVIATR